MDKYIDTNLVYLNIQVFFLLPLKYYLKLFIKITKLVLATCRFVKSIKPTTIGSITSYIT